MKLSREIEDGLRVLVYLAREQADTPRQASELADASGLTRPFVAKILVRLARAGILKSFRGRQRGYALARSPGEVSIRDVVLAIDGPELFNRCVFWSNQCSDISPCVLHPAWQVARPLVVDVLERTSIQQLASSVDSTR